MSLFDWLSPLHHLPHQHHGTCTTWHFLAFSHYLSSLHLPFARKCCSSDLPCGSILCLRLQLVVIATSSPTCHCNQAHTATWWQPAFSHYLSWAKLRNARLRASPDRDTCHNLVSSASLVPCHQCSMVGQNFASILSDWHHRWGPCTSVSFQKLFVLRHYQSCVQ